MDRNALFCAELIAEIKPAINEQKKAFGLKAKNPVQVFYIKATDDLIPLLETQNKQLAAGARADEVVFNEDGIEYSDTPREGIQIAVKA